MRFAHPLSDMRYPTNDNYALSPGYLCWFRDTLPNPIRVHNINRAVSSEDIESAEMVSEFHCQCFDLSNIADQQKYTIVTQRIIDGWYSLIYQQRHWDEETGKMKIWMEWTQDYMETPNGREAEN